MLNFNKIEELVVITGPSSLESGVRTDSKMEKNWKRRITVTDKY